MVCGFHTVLQSVMFIISSSIFFGLSLKLLDHHKRVCLGDQACAARHVTMPSHPTGEARNFCILYAKLCEKHWRSSDYGLKRTALKGKSSLPLGEVLILKRDVIEENHCLIQ